jgi:hypothetical protein
MLLRLPVSPVPFSVPGDPNSYPKLILDIYTLGLLETGNPLFDSIDEIEDQLNKGVVATIEEYYQGNDPMVREFAARVDHIMHNHTGIGIAIFWVQRPGHRGS